MAWRSNGRVRRRCRHDRGVRFGLAASQPRAVHRPRRHRGAARRTRPGAEARPRVVRQQRQPHRHGRGHVHAQHLRAAPLLPSDRRRGRCGRGLSRAGGTGHRGRAPHAAGDRGHQHAPGRHLPAGPAVCGTRPGGRERRGRHGRARARHPGGRLGRCVARAAVPPWRFERPARGPAPRPALRGRRSRRGLPGAVRHGIACAEGERTHRPRATPAGPVPHDGRARRHDGRPPGRPRRPALRAARRAWFPRRGRRGPPRWRGPRARDPRGLRGAAASSPGGAADVLAAACLLDRTCEGP